MARNKSGCWTCRLQTKKKCDEAKPTCKRCAERRVHCFGYGPRPSQDELGGDRRARIARVEAAASTEDSQFRVWRPKLQVLKSTQSDKQLVRAQPQSCLPPDLPVSLTRLDRPNSDMLNFLHPRLLSNYTERVFWLDSSFYQSPWPYHGNSWAKPFLLRSMQTHLAAALMGLAWEAVQDDISRVIDIDFSRPLITLHSLVIGIVKDEIERSQRVVKKSERATLAANLAQCASILLIFEAWRTLEGDWIPHLHGMSDILRWTITHAPDALDVATRLRVEQGSPERDTTALTVGVPTLDATIDSLALRWFLQSYTWNDITSAVWAGPQYTGSRCNNYYIPLLEKGRLQLDKFMGCEDSVLFLISRISLLEESATKPSDDAKIRESLCEAVELELKLNAELLSVLIMRCQYPPGAERNASLTTEMWILAALVYLHVVAIGSRCSHPKLRDYVARGLDAYRNLPRCLDIHIAMPFGVLASMANEDEAQEFLGIAESPRTLEEINPGQRKTFGIIKECWKMRTRIEASSPTDGVSWRDGAASLGLVILPV